MKCFLIENTKKSSLARLNLAALFILYQKVVALPFAGLSLSLFI
ncbi:hypothetical protein CUZ97_2572 [Enterococcus faecium]|nr:hypothetical protein [Enterococcus faecium]